MDAFRRSLAMWIGRVQARVAHCMTVAEPPGGALASTLCRIGPQFGRARSIPYRAPEQAHRR